MTVPDRYFSEPKLASLYDRFCADRDDLAFYLDYVMAADSVLDVGCGTGALLRAARARGHRGRLCGLDPAEGMLAVARDRPDIEWVEGTLETMQFDEAFDLVVMSGHAFQVLLDDEEISRALAAVYAALQPGGRFAFETRNPLARAWDGWSGAYRGAVRTAEGARVTMTTRLDTPMKDECVTFTHVFECADWTAVETSTSTLRFMAAEPLVRRLEDAGFAVEEEFGDWGREPFVPSSPEIIIVARRPAAFARELAS